MPLESINLYSKGINFILISKSRSFKVKFKGILIVSLFKQNRVNYKEMQYIITLKGGSNYEEIYID